METVDQRVARMRREQERRDDQRRQDQQKADDRRREDQQRFQDQRRREEAERQQRSSERVRLAEEKRHNRAMETAAARQAHRPTSKKRQGQVSRSAAPSARPRGGMFKWIIVAGAAFALIHFWPDISSIARTAPSPTHREGPAAADLKGRSGAEAHSKKASADEYPPCSATVTDHCKQD